MGGATLALPWMESFGKEAAVVEPARRIAWFYVPIGVVRRGFFPGEAAAEIPKFTGSRKEMAEGVKQIPVGAHPLELTPTMKPLERMREKVTLITGMDRTFQPGTDVHAQCASCFLTSASALTVTQSPYPLARSLDHVIADMAGKNTPFRTLEFSCNSHKDNKESMYFDNISWYGTGHVAPSLRDPRKAYRRLFGTKEIKAYRNITDLVLEDARSLRHRLGYSDQQKFNEYFDSIRTIEEQTGKLEEMRGQLAKARIEEPPEAHVPRGEYIRLMGDLMVVALQTGLTNVATFMIGPERWDTPFMYEGVFDKPRSHHQMSHNQNKFIGDLEKLDRFHMEQFAYLAGKMDSIVEADGSTLLDNTIFTYGSGLGDGATHQYSDLPIIVAGSGGGTLKTGDHIACPEGTPLANLWLTQAQAMGLKQDRFADSASVIAQLRTTS